MASKIDCPKVDGIYCLDYFWDHKAMPEVCRKILSKELAHAYEIFSQGSSDNSILVHEKKRGVVSMCPGHHHGQLGNLRLVMIVDPRKTSKGLVSLFFPCYHNQEYSAMLNGAQSVYDGFKEITFATKKDLERFENNAPVKVRPLVVVGFYKVIFEESKEKDQMVQLYKDTEKESNITSTQKKQMEMMYKHFINELYEWYEYLSDEGYTEEDAYKEVLKTVFQKYSPKCVKGWEKHIKDILLSNKDKDFSDFVIPYLVMWENEQMSPSYSISQGGRDDY